MSFKLSARNIIAAATAPYTAGTSLLFAKDDKGNSGLDYITGEKSAREMEQRQKQYQDKTNELSIELANSAHQREVNDLKLAGLNPVLSAGGTGATTPVLGTATAQNEMPGGLMSQATQAAQIANLAGTAKQANEQAKLTKEQTKMQPDLMQSEINMNIANANKALKEAGFTEKQIEFYNKTGVFPGASYSRSISGNGNVTVGKDGVSIGGGGSYSETNPITARGQKFRYEEINNGNENNKNNNKNTKKISKILKKLI